ncbi:MAG TPA: Nif3-like dinuclear metal center hexameric protein [Gemmatimonadales bacterium]|nr:Nif3-like dinuclear metal center hexameric protein [Gemmatimonadales bacterium]
MTRAAELRDLVAWLDGYLRIAEAPDHPNAVNGLQVENSGQVTRIVAAVDASLETIAGLRRNDLLLTHHGLLWDGNQPVTGRRYRRLKALFDLDAALYSAHIPLDLHPDVGNNVLLARALGVGVSGGFGLHQGVAIGVQGALAMDRSDLVARIASLLGGPLKLIAGGPTRTSRIAIVTGAGGGLVREARDAGCDTLITGEGAHHTYFDAVEWGVNLVYAGHYATETLGVKALAEKTALQFGLPWEFHDHPTGL